MSEIHMKRAHAIGLSKARTAAGKVARDLEEAFGMKSEWQGNTLHFSRSGVHGTLSVTGKEVALDAKLGLLLTAIKPKLVAYIEKDFDKYFG